MLAYMQEYVEKLVSKARNRIWDVVAKYGKLPVIVSFSGGKDSAAALAAAVDALGTDPVVAYFIHIPGQTIRDNVLAARLVAERLGLLWETIVWEYDTPLPAVGGTVYHVIVKDWPYWELLAIKGTPLPPPRPRWCCKRFKEEPLGYAPCAPTTLDGRRACARIVVVGVKRSDSRARAKRWANTHAKVFEREDSMDIAVAPLVDMNDAEVWALLSYHNIHDIVKEQYDRWGRSPNCVLCPLSSKKQLERAARLLPTSFLQRYYEALKNWDTQLARRMREILEAELEKRRGPARELGRG